MAEHLYMVRHMAEASPLPVIADAHTGFGIAINVLHTAEQYERAGAAAIVMEDKSFPKVSSLLEGRRQDLLRLEEFVGKIEATIDARDDGDLVIVARAEALIAGMASRKPSNEPTRTSTLVPT
jgi:phosphoenolpyruvate phosphomutase